MKILYPNETLMNLTNSIEFIVLFCWESCLAWDDGDGGVSSQENAYISNQVFEIEWNPVSLRKS